MYAPSDFEQPLLMKAFAETFRECVFLSIYISSLHIELELLRVYL